jgi:hypothetical protein
MLKSEVATVVVGVVATFIGYLAVNPAAAIELRDWLRQEIRKDMPDAATIHHASAKPAPTQLGIGM